MKAIYKWTLLAGIVLLFGQMTAQKPKVQVTFQLVKGTLFYDRYKADTAIIKSEGLRILKDSLNQYLPFIDFTTSASNYKLAIQLDQKMVEGSTITKEYYLFLTFTSPSQLPVKDQWLFLKAAKFGLLKPEASSPLEALKLSWSEYLKANYDLILVHNMFQNIPIDIQDIQYYYVSGNRNELILPYTKKDIKLFPTGTEFKVEVKGIAGSSPTEQTLSPVHYAGEVDPSMGKPQNMRGCIRIGLNQVIFNQFTSGKVYFTKYARDFAASTTTPGSFIDNSQTP